VNSTNYEKAYLIEYGYKYEDPTRIYVLLPNPARTGQMKSNSRSNGRKNNKSNDDLSA
jgi:hypothetical protein